MREEFKHIEFAPEKIKNIIMKVLTLEKEKLYSLRPRGIKEDIINIIKEEIN